MSLPTSRGVFCFVGRLEGILSIQMHRRGIYQPRTRIYDIYSLDFSLTAFPLSRNCSVPAIHTDCRLNARPTFHRRHLTFSTLTPHMTHGFCSSYGITV